MFALLLILLVVRLCLTAAVDGCNTGHTRGGRFGASTLFHFLLEVFVGDGDVVFGCLLLECLFSCLSKTELVDRVCKPDALFAVGGNVVKQTARSTHGTSSEFRAGFLAGGAECADFGGVGSALSEQPVVDAQSFAAAFNAFSAPGDGKALLFGDNRSGFFFGLFGSLGGFPFSVFFSLAGRFRGFAFCQFGCLFRLLFSQLGSLGGFLVGILFGFFGSLASFLGGFPFSFFGSLGGFPFSVFGSFLGSPAGFAFFLGEDGFGGLFFGFLGGSYLFDGVAISVEFDDFGLGLGFLQGLGLRSTGTFLHGERERRRGEFSDEQATDGFAIEILALACKNGDENVDEFVAHLFSHFSRQLRETLFHDGVRRESHGRGRELSLGHSIVIDS